MPKFQCSELYCFDRITYLAAFVLQQHIVYTMQSSYFIQQPLSTING